jgi:hypothetical protein
MAVYIDGYPMDLAISEAHGFEASVTEHPVERGADMVDHVRARPIEIELECVVSDTPIGAIATDPTRQAEGQDAPLPSEDAYARLQAIRDARQPVTIETSLGTWTSMALVMLSVPRSRETTGGLFFTATFRQVRVVETQRVTVRTAQPNAKRTGRHGHRSGKKVAGKIFEWRPRYPPGTGSDVGVLILVESRDGGLYYGEDVPRGTLPSATLSGARERKRGEALDSTDRKWFATDLAGTTRDRASRVNSDAIVGAIFDEDTPVGNVAPPPEVYEAEKFRSGIPVF